MNHQYSSLLIDAYLTGFAKDLSRVMLSSGSRAANQSDGVGYESGAIVPLPPWRVPVPSEMSILRARTPLGSEAVRIVRCDVKSVRQLADERRKAGGPVSSSAMVRQLLPEELRRLVDDLSADAGLSMADVSQLGIFINPPGLRTATVDSDKQAKIGLHVDNFSGAPPYARNQVSSRLCINLGQEPRRFLFVNLTYSSIWGRFRETMNHDHVGVPTDLARMFLRRFPHYPVISIRVDPLEGYVAATENLIHDGTTEHMESHDAILTLLGHFGNGAL